MPDIDVDIQDSRRDEVIQYCADKYGHDRVSNIVTFGRMFARNAVRDVALCRCHTRMLIAWLR